MGIAGYQRGSMFVRWYFIGRNRTHLLERNTSGKDNPAFAVNVVARMYVSRLRIIGNSNSNALEEVDEALPRERAFSQLLEEIVLNILLPYVHIGADKSPKERVRIILCRATSFIFREQGGRG